MTQHDRWFRLDAVRADLRARSVRSGFIAVGARGGQILIQVGSAVVLARLLTPEHFGVLAMVLPLTLLVNSTVNHGLQTSLIHREALDHEEASAMFWFAAKVNLLACSAMALAAPLFARLYDDPRVGLLGPAWAGVVYGTALASVPEALLKRQLRFGTVMSLHVGALGAGTVLAIVAALMGAGYWALFLQIATMDLGRAAGMWLVCDWRPSRRAPLSVAASEGVRSLRSYWAHLCGFRVLTWLGDNPDRILVGALGGATVVGLYDSARRWAWYPFVELFISLSDVAVASFSRVRDDVARYRELVRRGLTPLLAVSLPVIAFVFVQAEPSVRLLLGDQWIGAVPFMRFMCIAAFAGALSRVTTWLYLSRGETRRQLRWALFFQSPVLLGSVIIGTRWGALGVAAAFAFGCVVLALPAVMYCLRATPLTLADYLRVVWRPVFASLSAAAILAAASPHLPATGALVMDFVVGLAFFGVCYVAGWVLLPGGMQATRELLDAVVELRGRKGKRAPETFTAAPPEGAEAVQTVEGSTT